MSRNFHKYNFLHEFFKISNENHNKVQYVLIVIFDSNLSVCEVSAPKIYQNYDKF